MHLICFISFNFKWDQWAKNSAGTPVKQRFERFQVYNEDDPLMMTAKIQGSTVKSAVGQQRLQSNGFEFPADIFGQSADSVLIDERHCSD